MRRNFLGLNILALMMLSGQALYADDAVSIGEDGHNNLFYGQYNVVEDHPDCAGLDEIALRVPLRADALEYVLSDPANTRGVSSRGEEVRTDQSCFITNRRGAEVTRTRIPCAQEPRDDLEGWIEELGISVALDGSALFCVSPMRVSHIDSDLTVTLTAAGEKTEFPVMSLANSEGLGTWYQYHTDAFKYVALSRADRRHPLMLTLTEVDVIVVETKCIPVHSPSADTEQLFVGFRANFAVVDDARQTCSDADCPNLEGPNPISFRGCT